MLRTCRPSARTYLLGSASFSSTSACTPCSRNSLASIKPVGPPPATITSIMNTPHSTKLALRPAAPRGPAARTPAPPPRARRESHQRFEVSRDPYVDVLRRIPHIRRSWPRSEILRHDPGLAARPPVRYRLRVGRGGGSALL